MTGLNYSLLFLYSPRNLSPFSIYPFLATNSSTLRNLRIKQQSPLHTKLLLALPSQNSFLVFRKTGTVSMEGKKLVDIVIVRLHDISAQLVQHADTTRLLSPWRCTCVPVEGHYSPVKNVREDIIHRGHSLRHTPVGTLETENETSRDHI